MPKSRFIGVIAAQVIAILSMTGCGADPVSVTQQFQEAVNSQNVESALEVLAEDAVFRVDGKPSRNGKAEIENWLSTQAELDFDIDGNPIASESGVSFENCSINSYQWSYYGIKAMSGTCDFLVEGGHITEFSIKFDENSKASLSNSSVIKPTDLIGIWTGEWPIPGADPHNGVITLNHLQFNEDGSARHAITADNLSTAPDSGHPGAHFKWTCDDYLLTLQNDGPASEGYCV